MSTVKFPLTDSETNMLNKVWEFIELFLFSKYTLFEWKHEITKRIINKYTPDEFYELEFILEKLLWNLRYTLAHFIHYDSKNLSNLTSNATSDHETSMNRLLNTIEYDNFSDAISNITKHNYIRSYTNKCLLHLVVPDGTRANDKYLYYDIEADNTFHNYCFYILSNKNLYNQVMEDPASVKHLKIEPIHINNMKNITIDYGFPNINMCRPFIFDKNKRIKRIDKFYFNSANTAK